MAELYIVKIVNKSGVCDSILLLQALEHLCEIDVDIINVSLSVVNDNYREEFEKIIYKLHNQGKIINISVRNGCQISFPADISNCYGIVGKTMNDIQYEFNADQDIQISSSLYPLFVPTISGMSQWFGGNSKATAMMSGIMGRWKCYKDADYDIVEKNLKKNIDSAIITNVEKQYTSLQKEKVFEKISAVIEKYYCDGMISLDTKFWDGNKCRITNTYSLLCEVQEILKIDLFKTVIAYEDMYTCDTFISYICRMLKEYR